MADGGGIAASRGVTQIGGRHPEGLTERTAEHGIIAEPVAGGDRTDAIAGAQIFAGAESAFEDDGDSVFSGRVGGALKF